MDEAIKYPGITHRAFIVDDLDALLLKLEQENIQVTEGPKYIGERRRVCFIRDRDGNVLEFDQIYPDATQQDRGISTMKLYDLELSGNCYKIRLFLSLLDIKYELVPIDLMNGQHKSPEFLQLNPLGQLPVLEDDNLILRDSQAILVYLAKKYGGDWFPSDAAEMALVTQWLSTAANEIARGPNDARLNKKFGFAIDLDAAQQKAEAILNLIEKHFSQTENQWLALDYPTIADIACFPYIALAPEGGIILDKYPAINQWCNQIKKLPNFIEMPGISK